MANSVDPDQTAPIGAVCSGSTLFIPPANFVCGGYTVLTLSVRVCVRVCVRPSVRPSVRL